LFIFPKCPRGFRIRIAPRVACGSKCNDQNRTKADRFKPMQGKKIMKIILATVARCGII
jgi:hypothetical protein